MSQCVDKIAHTCGTSKGLQVFQEDDGRFTGYCFRCSTYVPDPYGDNPPPPFEVKTPDERAEELGEIQAYPIKDLPTRGLRAETLKYFGARTAVSETDGHTPVAVYLPYGRGGLTGYKFRDLTEKKKMWCIGTIKGADMFGWGRAIRSGQKTLYITEGEFDAMALYQILKDGNKHTEYSANNPAVVSIKSGAGSAAKDILAARGDIRKYFQEVVLVFDMDEPGREAAGQVARVFPEATVAELPEKDANECLVAGASKACRSAVLFRSARPKNTRLVFGSTLASVAMVPPEMGLSWPWDGLTDATRGIRRGETIYFGAGVKMGKSELVNAIAEHMIVEHGKRVFVVKPEEVMAKSYKMLVGKAAGRIFHDPKIPFDQEAWDAAEPKIGDNAIFCDVYQFVDWETLKEDIRYAVVNEGVEDVIIDPITCLTNQMSASEANERLVSLTAELSAMSLDHGFTSYVFCHLKAPDNQNLPHERGGKVLSTQFAGSRAMMRSCNYMIGMRGNKDPDLEPYERNMRYLEVLEDREFGNVDVIPLYWDYKTGLFNEVKS